MEKHWYDYLWIDPSEFKVDEELAKKWLNNGAQPTEVVGKIDH